MAADRVPFIDGHNDVLLDLRLRGEGARPFLTRRDEGHLDLVRAAEGGFAGGFFAAFVLPESEEERTATKIPDRTPPYAQPLAGPVPTAYAEREAGAMIDRVIDHVDHVVGRIGIDHVGFGSDFDGAKIPTELGDASQLQRVVAALDDRGYTTGAIAKLAHANWLRVLSEKWRR